MLQTSFCFLHLDQLRSNRLGKHLICISLGLCFNHLNVSFRLSLDLISFCLSQSGLLIQLCNLCILLCLLLCANLLHQGIVRLCVNNQRGGNIDTIFCGQLLIQIVGNCSINTCTVIGINLHNTELRSNFLDISNNIILDLTLHQALSVHIQYVDKGAKAVDPTTRIDNPISIPTYESTISTDFTFKGWDTELAPAFSNETVTAVYTESVRKYHVRYMNHGNILQDTEAPYGSLVLYDGDIPSYTAEETAFKFYLFSGWDKGGYVNGEKDINAVFDSCAYTTGYFDGKELRNLRPVEIYTMNQVGIANQVVEDKDDITIRMGNDFTYDDIVENVIVSRETAFNGSNYIDTGIKLLNEDRDWVIAVDYSMAGSNNRNSTLMQCYETNGTNGFRLWANGLAKVSWGTGSTDGASFDTRDMLVLRHIKGENSIHIYCANCYGDNINYVEIAKNRLTKTDATLVLGCAKADDGAYENFATGVIYWAKLWYADLGDAACRQLAAWTHEEFEFEACGFKRYYLSNSSKRSSLTFLQKTTLGKKMALSQASSNENGWGGTTVRTYLDSRIVKALPIGWQQLIKQVKVPSSAGGTSTDIVTADSYFFIPSAIEVDPTMTTEPYVNEGDSISFMTTNESRACTDLDGNKTNYWTRSPFISYRNYFYSVSETGNLYGYLFPSDQAGIRLMFCV